MLVTLAATDSDSHVGAISKLAELFMNDEHVEAICNAQTADDVLAIISHY
jgi:PTS system ascorbate-specific IIA component